MPRDNPCAINGLTGRSAARAIPVLRRLVCSTPIAESDPGIPGDCDRAAGLRPSPASPAEPRAGRQPGRPAAGGVGRADRLRIHHDQPYQCRAQGDRRQRRRAAPDPHHRPQGLSLRRRGPRFPGAGGAGFREGGAGRIERDRRRGAGPSGQAFHRRLALPESERGPRPGLLRRWRGGRHHRGPVADSLAVRHRAQFELRLQGPAGGRRSRSAASSACAMCWKAACARRPTGCASRVS